MSQINNENLFYQMLNFFYKLNTKINLGKFLLSLSDNDEINDILSKVLVKPILLTQMSILYSINPEKYKFKLNKTVLDFFGTCFKQNVVFILTEDGDLLFILVMQTNRDERTKINDFFAQNSNIITDFQFMTTEYDFNLEFFKLLTAKIHTKEKALDVSLNFY